MGLPDERQVGRTWGEDVGYGIAQVGTTSGLGLKDSQGQPVFT